MIKSNMASRLKIFTANTNALMENNNLRSNFSTTNTIALMEDSIFAVTFCDHKYEHKIHINKKTIIMLNSL